MNEDHHAEAKRKPHPLWWLFVGLIVGALPYIYQLADANRHRPGTGGEGVIVPMLILGYYLWKYWKEGWMKNVYAQIRPHIKRSGLRSRP